MTLISTITLGSGGSSGITFSSIPNTYTDLIALFSLRTSHTAGGSAIAMTMQLNGDGGANYSRMSLVGNGSGATSTYTGNSSNFTFFGIANNNATANTFGNGQIYFPNYTSNILKNVSVDLVSESESGAQYQSLTNGRWNNSAAITSIFLKGSTAENLMEFSSASLYGILKGSGGATVS